MDSSTTWIIPFPKDYSRNGQKWVGLIPCHNCDEWQVVRIDKRNKPYAACDSKIRLGGCHGGKYEWPVGTPMPDSTRATLDAMTPDIATLPEEYLNTLAAAWGVSPDDLTKGTTHDCIQEQTRQETETPEVPGTDAGDAGANAGSPENADAEKPGEPGAVAGDFGEQDAGEPGADAGSSEPESDGDGDRPGDGDNVLDDFEELYG